MRVKEGPVASSRQQHLSSLEPKGDCFCDKDGFGYCYDKEDNGDDKPVCNGCIENCDEECENPVCNCDGEKCKCECEGENCDEACRNCCRLSDGSIDIDCC